MDTQLEKSSQLPSGPQPQAVEGISVITIVFIFKAFKEFLDWFFGFFFGGPAGSGGVFRKAAIDTNTQLDALRKNLEPLLVRVVNEEPLQWPRILETWNVEIGKVYTAQHEMWLEYEGRNLLGATFYGGWTNATIQRNHNYRMMLQQAFISNELFRLNLVEINKIKQRLALLDKKGPLEDIVFDMIERLDKIDELLSPQIINLVKSLPELYGTMEKVIKRVLDLEAGKIGATDPKTRILIAALLNALAEFANVVGGLPPGFTHDQLLQRIGELRQLADFVGRFIAQTKAQLQNYPLPKMQADIRKLQEQVKEIPAIQEDIKGLQDQIDDITKQQIPKLRDQLQKQITPLNQRVKSLENRLDRVQNVHLPALRLLIDRWIDSWPKRRKDVFDDACQCANDYTDKRFQQELTCKKILQLLCECRDSQDPEIVELWKCLLGATKESNITLPVFLHGKWPTIIRS